MAGSPLIAVEHLDPIIEAMQARLHRGLHQAPRIALACLVAAALSAQDPAAPRSGDAAISAALATILTQHRVPAMAGAIVTSAGLQRMGAAGWRKAGDPTPVTVDDQWHLGSDTKAMTATVIARFVERGLLHWDSSVAQVLPEAGPGWDSVTLDRLLTHRAGIIAEPDYLGTPTRAAAVRVITGRPPATVPGSTYHYSNSGYVLAGAMLERVAGKPWEELIRSELWAPLHMDGCGFGGMGTPGGVDQPWQHKRGGEVAGNGPQTDNPPVMGPAGTVHMPIRAWAAFVADQLKGARGEPALLRSESYEHLQTPWPGGEYARGWLVLQRDWAHGKALTHTGSNTMNTAVVWIGPGSNLALLVCCNQDGADAACDEAVVALMKSAGIRP